MYPSISINLDIMMTGVEYVYMIKWHSVREEL